MTACEFAPDDIVFGHCPRCATENLTWVDADPDGDFSRRCVRCDEPIDAQLRDGDDDDLTDAGLAPIAAEGERAGGGCGCSSGGGCSR